MKIETLEILICGNCGNEQCKDKEGHCKAFDILKDMTTITEKWKEYLAHRVKKFIEEKKND